MGIEDKLAAVERYTKMVEEAQRMLADRLVDLRKSKYELRTYITQNDIKGSAFRVGDKIFIVDNERDEMRVDIVDSIEVQV